MFEIIKKINVIFGKHVKRRRRKKSEKPTKESPFKKQLIFLVILNILERVRD
jgi:hypothetical protein